MRAILSILSFKLSKEDINNIVQNNYTIILIARSRFTFISSFFNSFAF